MDCSTPGLSVPQGLPNFAQVHVHCIGDAIQPSHPLMPSSPALNLSQASILWCSAFFMVQLSRPLCDHWEVHSLDYVDLCRQSNVSVSRSAIAFPAKKQLSSDFMTAVTTAVILEPKKRESNCSVQFNRSDVSDSL